MHQERLIKNKKKGDVSIFFAFKNPFIGTKVFINKFKEYYGIKFENLRRDRSVKAGK